MSLTIIAIGFAVLFLLGALVMSVQNKGKVPSRHRVSYTIAWLFVLMVIASLNIAYWQFSINRTASKVQWNELCWERGGVLEYDRCMQPGFEEVKMPELK